MFNIAIIKRCRQKFDKYLSGKKIDIKKVLQ